MVMTAKEWVDNWKRVGPILERIREAELQGKDPSEIVREFMSKRDEPEKTSELEENHKKPNI